MIDLLYNKNKLRLQGKNIIFMWYGHGLFIYDYKYLVWKLFDILKKSTIYLTGTTK